jgi:hypothetical protein
MSEREQRWPMVGDHIAAAIEAAAHAAAQEIEEYAGGRRRRGQDLAERVERVVTETARGELARPVPMPRRLLYDLSMTAEAALECLLALPGGEFNHVLKEATGRRMLELDLVVLALEQGDDPPGDGLDVEP